MTRAPPTIRVLTYRQAGMLLMWAQWHDIPVTVEGLVVTFKNRRDRQWLVEIAESHSTTSPALHFLHTTLAAQR